MSHAGKNEPRILNEGARPQPVKMAVLAVTISHAEGLNG